MRPPCPHPPAKQPLRVPAELTTSLSGKPQKNGFAGRERSWPVCAGEGRPRLAAGRPWTASLKMLSWLRTSGLAAQRREEKPQRISSVCLDIERGEGVHAAQYYRITELFRLEKTFQPIESLRPPSAARSPPTPVPQH